MAGAHGWRAAAGAEREPKKKKKKKRTTDVWRHTLTFVRLLRSARLLHLLGRLHEEREDGAQAQDVHKLVAVVRPLRADHAVVQHLQGAGPGHFLLPVRPRRETGTVELFYRFLFPAYFYFKKNNSPPPPVFSSFLVN